MFDKFKNLARLLSFVFIFNFLVLDFGIKPKVVKASEISSIKTINYDISVVDNYMVFDFSKYLSENDTIEEVSFLKGDTKLNIENRDNSKKSWRTREVLIHGTTYKLNIKGNIGGTSRKLVSTFVYNDYDIDFKPVMAIAGNNIECDIKTWAGQFPENINIDVDILSTNGSVEIQKVTKTVKQAKANKIVFENKKASLQNKGYIVRAKVANREYRSKFYYSGKWAKNLNVELVSGKVKQDKSNLFDIELKINMALSNGDSLRIYAGGADYNQGVHKGDNVYKFENVEMSFNRDYHVRVESTDPERIRESMFSFCSLNKIEKLNSKVDSPSGSGLNFDLSNLNNFLSINSSNNKIYIYELNDNFSKGNKIGEKTSVTASSGIVVSLNSGVSLSTNKNYLVEVTNGSKTVSSSFMYVTMGTSATEVKETSVKINWTYPTGYTPQAEHKIEIYLRDKANSDSYKAIPNAALVHGAGNGRVDLSKTTSTVVDGLAPGTNYEAKVVLNNQRGSITSFTNFTTTTFVLTGPIQIKDSSIGTDYFKIAYPRSRTITVEWDFKPNNIQFSSGDKVEIWVKPNTTNEFSGYPSTDKYKNPLFTKTGNLNSTKSATITIPSWMDKFHVDLIYTIGGKKIITSKESGVDGEWAYNRRTVQSTVNKPKVEVTDITQTTAKVKWEYDSNFGEDYEKYQPENGQIVMVNLKKVNSNNDKTVEGFDDNNRKLRIEHGKEDGNLSSSKELDLTGLEVGQWYRVRVRHILQTPEFGFDDKWRFVDEFYNFQTESFKIENLKAEQQTTEDSRKVKLTWRTSGNSDFGEGTEEKDNIKVYLKEANTSDYPVNPETVEIKDVTIEASKNILQRGDESDNQQEKPTKECIIDLLKYNTPYTAKIEYNIGGKKIEEHVLLEAIGDISITISEITTNGSKVTCNLPTGYNKKDTDNVKLTVVKRQKDSSLLTDIDMNIDDNKATYSITDISENDVCDVTVKFENGGKIVGTTSGSFKATTDFQITNINVSDIKATTAKLTWDFLPTEKLNDVKENDDKIDIYLKSNNVKQRLDEDDSLNNFTKIYTIKHKTGEMALMNQNINVRTGDGQHSKHEEVQADITKFKELDLTGLKSNDDYTIKVEYNISSDLNLGDQAKKEGEFSFKTISDEFKATVFTSNQTTATYGWEYPPGYVIQKGDKVEIFVKDVTENQQHNSNGNGYGDALLTLVHDEGEYNLNEVTRVDVSGLTPERKYKSKIVFTMNGDHVTQTEVDISTKSFEIKSFEVDSYENYDILVKWEIEPENMVFNPSDKAEIFVKLATDSDYPADSSYKLTTEGENNISNTFSDYVLAESIGVEQDMKLVYTIGDKTYEKELTFTNTIDPLQAKVYSINETRALIEVTTPSNYEFVNGDKLLIYAKDEFANGEVQSDDFLVFEGVQSDTLSIADDMKLIELSYLLPEANYEIVVALDLEDGTVDPVKLELFTEPLPITDIKLESINYDGSTISWNYGENEIDFYKDQDDNYSDKLLIGVKESDGTPIPDDFNAIKQITVQEHSGPDIANVKDARIQVEDRSKDYDVAVCCDIGGLSYIKKTKLSFLSASVDESSILSDGAKVNWKYPSNITFGDSDKTEVFLRKKEDADYPESPAFSSTGSGTTSYTLEGLEGSTEYIVKVQITKEGLQIDPVEAEFTTKGAAASEVVVEEPEYEITGTAAEISIPNVEELDIDLDQPIGLKMGDEPFTGFSIEFNESGTGFTIQPTIPKKKYENIEVEIPLKDGTTFKMVIKEFTTQPADVAQDWLSNAYSFALERFPDEEGYNYWYTSRIKAKTLNGEYFLKNLLFAEDEFTNRNLQDRELIAALYQIVVNREYDEEGLNFWVGIYGENLQNAQGNKKLAQEVLVDRMAHEPEFGKLCERVGIFWRQSDQDAAGVPS